MPKSYIGGFEKIRKNKRPRWDDEESYLKNDKYKNKRQPKKRDFDKRDNPNMNESYEENWND